MPVAWFPFSSAEAANGIIKYLKTAYYDKCLPDNIVRCRF